MKQILVKNIRTQGGIVAICDYTKVIAMLDNMAHLYYVSNDSIEQLGSIIILQNNQMQHKYCKIPSFCKTKNRLAYAEKDSKELKIYRHNGSKIEDLTTLKWHTQNLESSHFSANGKFIVTGGADGRSFLFETTRFRPIITFKRRPDYIHLTQFSDDSHFLAISSFDKLVSIYNVNRHMLDSLLTLDDIVETMLFYKNILFFASRDQKFGIFDIDTKKLIIAKDSSVFWPTSCALIPDSDYVILGGRSEYLIVISTVTLQIVKKIALSRVCGVTLLSFVGDNFFVSFVDGITEIFNFNKGRKEMQICLEVKDFLSVSKLCSENPFLLLDKNYENVLLKEWEKLLPKVIDMIANNKTEEAFGLSQPFLFNKERKAQFDFYVLKRLDGAEFLGAISKKDFTKAYTLAYKNSYLQKLDVYSIMEEDWIKTYAKAKRLLEADAHKNKQAAFDLLIPYSRVESKKDYISAMLLYYGKFKEAEDSVRRQDFKQYFIHCAAYPFLHETELYQKIFALGEALLDKATKQEYTEDYNLALQTLDSLKDFSPFVKTASERSSLILTKKLFSEAVNQNYLKVAYSYVDAHKEITQMQKFIEMDFRIQGILDEALQIAFDGEEKKLQSILYPIIDIPYWANNIKTLKRIAAVTNLKREISLMQRKEALNAIEKCFDKYGADGELEKLCAENGFGDFYQQLNSK